MSKTHCDKKWFNFAQCLSCHDPWRDNAKRKNLILLGEVLCIDHEKILHKQIDKHSDGSHLSMSSLSVI